MNVGGTGATLALALLLCRSRDAGYRKVARVSLPTQVFQINEPIFFGLPIVLNPIFMVPYVLNALLLTAATYALMTWGLIRRPFINVPWTTPPILGHYLVTGGDWRAAVWGVVSIADGDGGLLSVCQGRDGPPRPSGGATDGYFTGGQEVRRNDAMKKWNLVAIATAAAVATMTDLGAQAPATYLQKDAHVPFRRRVREARPAES